MSQGTRSGANAAAPAGAQAAPVGAARDASVVAMAPEIPKEAVYSIEVLKSADVARSFVATVETLRRTYQTPGVHDNIIDGSAFFPPNLRAAKTLASVAGKPIDDFKGLFDFIKQKHELEQMVAPTDAQMQAAINKLAGECRDGERETLDLAVTLSRVFLFDCREARELSATLTQEKVFDSAKKRPVEQKVLQAFYTLLPEGFKVLAEKHFKESVPSVAPDRITMEGIETFLDASVSDRSLIGAWAQKEATRNKEAKAAQKSDAKAGQGQGKTQAGAQQKAQARGGQGTTTAAATGAATKSDGARTTPLPKYFDGKDEATIAAIRAKVKESFKEAEVNACYYCHGDGHLKSACPDKAAHKPSMRSKFEAKIAQEWKSG